MDRGGNLADQAQLPIGERRAYNARRMQLTILFVLGVLNFAANKAVLDSGHPLLESLPNAVRAGGGRISLLFEFLVLLAAMLLAAHGWPAATWAYGIYTALNSIMAWAVITNRL